MRGFVPARNDEISTYPRKGTETNRYSVVNVLSPDFNLSPQGDGNLYNFGHFCNSHYFNLSPQGDGNYFQSPLTAYSSFISTYPRKGTETFPCAFDIRLHRFQLIPARGRKPVQVVSGVAMATISTYPRKGTETKTETTGKSHRSISTYPRKGTETQSFMLMVSPATHFNLSPQGDGNASQRRSVGTNRLFQLIPARGRKRSRPHRHQQE